MSTSLCVKEASPEPTEDVKIELKYQELSVIEDNLIKQIKLVFIFAKFNSNEIIFITNTDEVYGYGTNQNGRLGLGHVEKVSSPEKFPDLCSKKVMKFEINDLAMVALTEQMEVYTCGYGAGEWLGNGTNSNTFEKPQLIEMSGISIADIKCGHVSTYLLTDTNEVYCFGNLACFGASNLSRPQKLDLGNEKVISISTGCYHALLLADNGNLFGWGMNGVGQLGLVHTNSTKSIIQIKLTKNIWIEKICCGNYHSLLLTRDGQIVAFGQNNLGQLGTGNNTNQLSPVIIKIDDKFIDIFAHGNLSMAINFKKEVIVWGYTLDYSPLKTSWTSYQEVINKLNIETFTYNPLTLDEIIIKKPESRVLDIISKAFNNEKYSDLKFKLKYSKNDSGYGYINCHKWVLAETSQYFQRMFENNWTESQSNEIEIKNHSYEAYYQFLRCLYTDSVGTKDLEVLIEMLSIADEHLEDKIKSKCAESIIPLTDVQNVCSLYSSAKKNRSEELEEFCFKFMSTNIVSIVETEGYEQMDANDLQMFFRRYFKGNAK